MKDMVSKTADMTGSAAGSLHEQAPQHEVPPGRLTHHLRAIGVSRALEIGREDAPEEKEADRVADAVMRMPDPASGPPRIQRMCAECKEEEDKAMLSRASGEPVIRRQGDGLEDEEDEVAMAKPTSGPTSVTATATASTQVATMRRAGGMPLPSTERSFFESRMGHDFGRVRLHMSGTADNASRAMHARAFTVGRDIGFRADASPVGGSVGRRLLAHELTHVVQQGHASQLDEPSD